MNGLIKTIADYNAKIVEAESTGDQANSLRDARELAVDKLAKLTDFKVFEEDNGSYSLSSGSVTFVTRDDYMTINTGLDSKTGFTTMTWSGTSKSFAPASGSIGAILNMRDVTIPSYLDKIDTLAGAIADQTNALHVYGRGLEDLTESASTNAVASTTAALTSAASGLTKPVTAGDVTVTRVDAGGTETATTITVGATTTLADLATQFSAAGLTATANSDGTLSLASASGESFYFSKSAGTASNMLSSLGINTFFTGSTAGDIGVNTAVVDNVALVAAGASSADADNTVAQEIADLRTNSSVANESTFERYYASSIIGTVGTEASTASRNVENQTISVNQLKDSIDSVSSVSTDEEVTNLTLLQQALTACARYVTALSTMMDDILNMV